MGPGPAKLWERELAAAAKDDTDRIRSVMAVDDTFVDALDGLFVKPLVVVSGSSHLDISPRRLDGRLTVHLVNTVGPHADAPAEGITAVPPIGPLIVAIRMSRAPKSVTQQPEDAALQVAWNDGQAIVTVPQLKLYSILVIEE